MCDQPDRLDEEDDEVFDEEAAEDFEEMFDDTTDNVEELRKEMNKKMVVLRNLRRFNEAPISLDEKTDHCSNLDPERDDTSTLQVIAVDAAIVAEAAHNQCDSGLNFDIAGFNASIVCVVTATISGIVNLFPAALELIESDINAMTLDASAKCLEQTDDKISEVKTTTNGLSTNIGNNNDMIQPTVFGKINSLSVKAGNTDAKVQAVFDMVDKLQKDVDAKFIALQAKINELNDLLTMPQGQRPDFNK